MIKILISFSLLVCLSNALKKGDCEVCIKTIQNFASQLSETSKKSTTEIENDFKTFCKRVAIGKEQRFCYYMGGDESSATGILSELSKPLSWSMPVEKICEKLKKKDSQICDLRYGKKTYRAFMFNSFILCDWSINCWVYVHVNKTIEVQICQNRQNLCACQSCLIFDVSTWYLIGNGVITRWRVHNNLLKKREVGNHFLQQNGCAAWSLGLVKSRGMIWS